MSFYDSIKLVINILLVIMMGFVFIWFFQEYRIIKLNNRLNKFSIVTSEKRHSLFDIIINYVLDFSKNIKKLLSKSKYFKKYAKKYEKYVTKENLVLVEAMDYVAAKFCLAISFVFILLISLVFQGNILSLLDILIAFTLGFYSLDFFLIGQKKYTEHEIKNDLLKAITIMNNCFKSGKSILQTIEIVSEELDGPLQKEFQKMREDLSYGLELEVVFERFNKRVDLPDIKYITTSLNILNKTGGNVVDVFDLIEKTVFTNKKLADELNNLSAASKFLYRMMMVIPIIFVFVIYLLDQTFFIPLFSSVLGYLIDFLIVFIYFMYIVIIKKIIKIREN